MHPEQVSAAPSTISDRAAQKGLTLFVQELRAQHRRPPGGDRVIRGLCGAAVGLLEEEAAADRRPFTALVKDFITWREALTPSDQVGIFRSVAQNHEYVRAAENGFPEEGFPHGWEDEARCRQTLLEIVDTMDNMTDMKEAGRLGYHFAVSRASTTIWGRERQMEWLGQLLGLQSVLDVGCGAMLGTKWLAMKNEFQERFGPETVRIVHKVRQVNKAGQPVVSMETEPVLQQGCDALLKRHSHWEVVRGCDKQDFSDRIIRDWSLSSMQPENELGNPEVMARVRYLAETDSPKAGFAVGDFTSPEGMRDFDEQFKGEKYDAVFMSTVLYQLPPKGRAAMLRMARRYLSPEGIIVVQDFAHVKLGQLAIYSEWHKPYRYRTYVYMPKYPKLGMQEVFLSYDSRCKTVQVGKGLLVFGGEPVPIADLLRIYARHWATSEQ